MVSRVVPAISDTMATSRLTSAFTAGFTGIWCTDDGYDKPVAQAPPSARRPDAPGIARPKVQFGGRFREQILWTSSSSTKSIVASRCARMRVRSCPPAHRGRAGFHPSAPAPNRPGARFQQLPGRRWLRPGQVDLAVQIGAFRELTAPGKADIFVQRQSGIQYRLHHGTAPMDMQLQHVLACKAGGF